jgi:hypothetical protein
MIYLYFKISNPFSSRFNSGRIWNGLIGLGHRAWEIQVMKTNSIVEFEFSITSRQDHAGVRLELGLLGRNICAQIYNTRHWDSEKNTWAKYG